MTFDSCRTFHVAGLAALFIVGGALAACSGSSSSNIGSGSGNGDGGVVQSNDDAKRAYLGLDTSIDKAIALGFKGFNDSSNANIPNESAPGAHAGTMTIGGQVDHGASNNKTMHLTETLVKYSDDGALAYDTGGTLPALDMTLNNIPSGTLTGSLNGNYAMSGALSGQVTLALTFNGDLEPGADGGVERKPGTTHITGTAVSPAGTYNVDVTR